MSSFIEKNRKYAQLNLLIFVHNHTQIIMIRINPLIYPLKIIEFIETALQFP